ncbi:hypothetical protein U9M48_037443 [Paspalum notatum var. saurae]|uniref:F-box domain-containing protein n=1 Tax=Paspalum notatum var. saurae TaxID=547442 RepID=A0AAQ3UFZ9_PASNO
MEPARPVPALSDDALREIFLRIRSPADLARAAAAACAAFRRLITDDPCFLRRYRALHPPPLLCLLEPEGYAFQPAEAPTPPLLSRAPSPAPPASASTTTCLASRETPGFSLVPEAASPSSGASSRRRRGSSPWTSRCAT